jgi:beta-glucosidase
MKNRTYRYYEGKALYPFGYGLSYSKFSYENPKLSASTINAGDSLGVDVDVKNTSSRDGDEVVQVYVSFPKTPGAPIHALRGFTRVHVPAGQVQHVHMDLTPRDLSEVNVNGDRLVVAGSYTLHLGGGQPGTDAVTVDLPLTVQQELKLSE